MSYQIPEHLTGLSDEEVIQAQRAHGYNQTSASGKPAWLELLLDLIKEPMLLLLLAVAAIYLIVGDYGEATFMIAAILAVSGISIYQDKKSRDALKELEKLNEPLSTVIRNGVAKKIPTREITIGDLCITEEGTLINADGNIVHSNDFSVNESMLTGESLPVYKDSTSPDHQVFAGTTTVSGLAIFKVSQIGNQTKVGQLGQSLQGIETEKSPLQKQISNFVKIMAAIGVVIFLMVWGYSFYQTGDWIESLLNGLTLAMSVLPEEIPVAFVTFTALGAWKLMREDIIIKRTNSLETLGALTMVCTDKTGTITQNLMELKHLYDFKTQKTYSEQDFLDKNLKNLIEYAMWASEPMPFNPMEKVLHELYEEVNTVDLRPDFEMVHEYPLGGKPPMMTHIYEDKEEKRIIAAKGSPEAIINVSQLGSNDKKALLEQVKAFGQKGYRVLGVAKAVFKGHDFPKNQEDFEFDFLGFTVFYDPPKKGIKSVFQRLYEAGIKVNIITGDNADTTLAIAEQAGIINKGKTISGNEWADVERVDWESISEKHTLFTRMFPEAKLNLIQTFKRKGEVVAMLGDGVNDAPALKAAHIGVAMGHKGTEIAKAAAALVITNDDLEKLVTGIAAGRRIYDNLKKAIQYIISIHIPIILTVSLPLFLGWIFPQIFTPVHVIFLELVMGPTCSLAYESEPMEEGTMNRPPREVNSTFLAGKDLLISVIQGLVITAGVLFMYRYSVYQGGDEYQTRAMVFSTLIFANIFLSYSNRSFYHSIFYSLRFKNTLLTGITVLVTLALMAILYFEPFSKFFKVSSLSGGHLFICFITAAVSVLWFEIYKFFVNK